MAASAHAASSRGFIAFSGPSESPTETVTLPTPGVSIPSKREDALRDVRGVRTVAATHDHAELLAAETADDVVGPHGAAQRVGERLQEVVADAVAVHVVDTLEVVDVEHEDGDGPVRPARLLQCVEQVVVEAAVVEETGERVGARLVLEARADLRVVDGERSSVGEALRELELDRREPDVGAGPVQVEDALDLRARDERDRDECLGLDRRPRHRLDARVEVRLVEEDRLAATRRPAGDALVEADLLSHHLVGPVVAREHRLEDALALVGLVDREGAVRDEVGQRVGDADQEGVERLLRKRVVPDVGEAPVRLDELELGRAEVLPEPGDGDETTSFGARYHRVSRGLGDCSRRAKPPVSDGGKNRRVRGREPPPVEGTGSGYGREHGDVATGAARGGCGCRSCLLWPTGPSQRHPPPAHG